MSASLQANPFDDAALSFLALRNEAGQYSLWPTFKAVPAGWTQVFGPADRAACLAHIAEHWTSLTPARA